MVRKLLMKNPHKVLPQLGVTLVASMGFFCIGNIRGWSSPGIPSLNATINSPDNLRNSSNYFDLPQSDLSWIASLAPLCALAGALAIGVPMQMYGRKIAIIGLSVPFIVGWLLMGLAYWGRHKAMLYIGRVLTGAVGGSATPACQIYITECSSPRVRGVLGSFTASALAFGILISYIIGAFVEWHVLALVHAGFSLIMMVAMMFMPETPGWYMSKGEETKARASLQRLRGSRTNVEVEFQRIKAMAATQSSSGNSFEMHELLKAPLMKPLGIVMGVFFFQQFTGINSIIYNTELIFRSAGSTIEGRYATIIVGFVQLVATLTSGSMVDKFGRKILLLGSGGVVSFSLAMLGMFFNLQKQWGAKEATETLGWLPLASLIVYFIAYSFGFASVPYIIMGELFPAQYRSLFGPITSSFNVLCTFTAVRCFPLMNAAFGSDGTFFFYMASTTASLFFVGFLLPETKGKTLEDIERLFGGNPSPTKKPSQPKFPPTSEGTTNESFERDISVAFDGVEGVADGGDKKTNNIEMTDRHGHHHDSHVHEKDTRRIVVDSEDEDDDDGFYVHAPF